MTSKNRIGMVALFALLLQLAESTAAEPQENRVIFLPMQGFQEDWDGAASSYIGIQQGIGYLGYKWGHKDTANALQRTIELVSVAYANAAMGYYIHELGHDINSSNLYHNVSREINILEWGGMPWPAYVRNWYMNDPYWSPEHYWQAQADTNKDFSTYYWVKEEEFRRTVGGFNMEEWSSRLLWRQSNRTLSYDEGLAFLYKKWSDVTYWLWSGTFGENMGQIEEGEGDVILIQQGYNNRGIETSPKSWYTQSLIADFLNIRIYESFLLGLRFWGKGKRTDHVFGLEGKYSTWIPPVIQLFWTSRGAYYESETAWLFKDSELYLQLGRDFDEWTNGYLRAYRLGIEYAKPKAVNIGSVFSKDLFWGYSLSSGFTGRRSPYNWSGGSFKAAQYWSRGNKELMLSLQFSSGDLLENVIKTRDPGWAWAGSFNFWL